MTQMTVIVEFETLEGAEPEFTRLISDHARRSLIEEEGCLRFEVIKPLDKDGRAQPNAIIVNELYANQAALDAHNASPRMKPLGAALAPLLKSSRLLVAKSLTDRPADDGLTPEELNAANDD